MTARSLLGSIATLDRWIAGGRSNDRSHTHLANPDCDRLAPIADSCSVQRQRQHKTRSGTAYLFHSMSVGVQCCSGLGKSTHA
jgi:hypothetical protein